MPASTRFEPQTVSPPTPQTTVPAAISPADMRVTPQEFAQAVEQIETRREAERQKAQETVAIGEAVDALNLSVSAGDIWGEVLRQRTQMGHVPRRASKRRLWPALLAASLLVNGLGLVYFLRSQPSPVPEQAPQIAAALTPPSKVTGGAVATPFGRLLSTVGNDDIVYADIDLLHRLAMGNVDQSKAYVAVAENAPGTLWPLHRENEKWFVTAYTSDDGALRLQNKTGAPVALFKVNIGVNATRVAVPVESFSTVSEENGTGSIASVDVLP